MKNLFIIILTIFLVLNAQNKDKANQQLNKIGITSEQAEVIAKDQGTTLKEIESAIKSGDIRPDNQGKDGTSSLTTPEVIEVNGVKYIKDGLRYIPIIGTKQTTVDPVTEIAPPTIESIAVAPMDDIEYFGYQIFNSDPSVFQSSTFGAVDPNYNIGPGDQIIVMLWGESQFRQEFTIDNEGYVFLPEVGQVFVNGLTLDALEKKFFQILSKPYSTLKPIIGKPTTFMDISLGNLRPLRIIVLGELSQPGAYSVSPSTSLFSSLYYFGGPTTMGSLRDIRLIRKGKQTGTIDFYDYLLSGKTPDDLRLQLDDVVFIPPRGKTVTIFGEINRQGIYELKETEGLKDLIKISGDLPVTAYMNRAQISRIVPAYDRSELGMDRIVIDIDIEAAIAANEDTELFDGDVLEIFSIEDLPKNYVIVRGSSVTRPGKYQLVPGMRVQDLINAADGLLNDAYLASAHIIRFSNDLTSELITIDLGKAISGDSKNNIVVQFMDELIVYNKNSLTNIFTSVVINGPVKFPGTYDLENNEKLNDLILAAGGFNAEVKKVKISIARINPNSFSPILYNIPSKDSGNDFIKINSLKNSENEVNNFVLKSRDIVNVYADPRDLSPGSVSITGSVLYPGNYPVLSSNEKVSDIIIRAGGLLPEAYPMASTFIRSGRTVKLSFEEIINNSKSKENFTVTVGDSINIFQKPNMVIITGEVNNPGLFKYYANQNVRDYIDKAGGLSINAEKNNIWVTYPDGTSQELKLFSPSPRVHDGSVITIGREEETQPLDKTEFAKEIASIIADFMQLVLTLIIISNTASG